MYTTVGQPSATVYGNVIIEIKHLDMAIVPVAHPEAYVARRSRDEDEPNVAAVHSGVLLTLRQVRYEPCEACIPHHANLSRGSELLLRHDSSALLLRVPWVPLL